MISRTALLLSVSVALTLVPAPARAQTPVEAAASRAPALLRDTIESPTRAIRRDVPLTNAIPKITLDPRGRFPERNPDDNVWTRSR